ncbi:MAG: cytochrome-c oxidase, cbb3-type subunit III [Boseongicola sp.]
MAKKPQSEQKQIETTGHSWDGIEELNTPLPSWWKWTFYATIVWGVIYTIAYPAWPMIDRATAGVLGYSTRAELAENIAAHEAKNANLATALAGTDLKVLSSQPELQHYAAARGAAVFRTNCSQCHGAGAAGAEGYPNLLDDAWLWGGDIENIMITIRHGVRNETDEDARWSEMPAFSDLLEAEEIEAVVGYVLSLSGPAPEDADIAAGAQLFADNCAACHGDTGLGDEEVGAPNIADAIWLYGGDAESVTHSVESARFGVMPGWGTRLSDADINAVSAYVHGLGGGE